MSIQKDLNDLKDRFQTDYTDKYLEIESFNSLMKDHGIKIPDKNEKKFKETHKLKISTDQKMS